MLITSWKKLIDECLEDTPEETVIACTLSDEELNVEFDVASDGYGEGGKPFTAWTQNRVLVPVSYDGNEWVVSIPRNPCDEVTLHVGNS